MTVDFPGVLHRKIQTNKTVGGINSHRGREFTTVPSVQHKGRVIWVFTATHTSKDGEDTARVGVGGGQ